MNDITKEYSNGEITVVWKPKMCIHSGNCTAGLPEVFQPNEKPWIKVEAASSADIMAQIEKCPSGALSYYKNEEKEEMQKDSTPDVRVEVMKNGPLMVHGEITVKGKDGNEETKTKVTAFCRCGLSSNKPYCDGTHNKQGFKDE